MPMKNYSVRSTRKSFCEKRAFNLKILLSFIIQYHTYMYIYYIYDMLVKKKSTKEGRRKLTVDRQILRIYFTRTGLGLTTLMVLWDLILSLLCLQNLLRRLLKWYFLVNLNQQLLTILLD